MKPFLWKPEKNQELKAKGDEGRISFEKIEIAISNGGLLGVFGNHSRYAGQVILAVRVGDYVYAVPASESESGVFLWTAYPSRKLTKLYGGKHEEET